MSGRGEERRIRGREVGVGGSRAGPPPQQTRVWAALNLARLQVLRTPHPHASCVRESSLHSCKGVACDETALSVDRLVRIMLTGPTLVSISNEGQGILSRGQVFEKGSVLKTVLSIILVYKNIKLELCCLSPRSGWKLPGTLFCLLTLLQRQPCLERDSSFCQKQGREAERGCIYHLR